jgi:phosphoribosyl 1,2-cyclic phosphate phosphodiesterase
VIDTGPDFRIQALREGLRRVDAVLYTHAHTDHIMGFDDLRPFCFDGRELPVYGSPETLEMLARCFVFAFNGENRWPGYILPLPQPVTGPFQLADLRIHPIPVPHGRQTTYGYLLERGGRRLLAYMTDCHEITPAACEQILGVECLVLDALRMKPHPTHMNFDQALAVVEKVRPAQAWFTHLAHDHAHADVESWLPPDSVTRVAYDGLKISICLS